MRIANKITLLIVFLLSLLGATVWFGLKQIGQIRSELAAKANYDMVLAESVTSIYELQLHKNILLQQLIGIAEELGFEQTSFARASYLKDQLKSIGLRADRYMQEGSAQGGRAAQAAHSALARVLDDAQRRDLLGIVQGLKALDTVRRQYNASLLHLLQSVEAGGFQLSLEDLENLQQQENRLSQNVRDLLVSVRKLSYGSVQRTTQWETDAQRTLLWGLLLGALAGIILGVWVARSIVRPLDRLSQAARQVGSGDFKVKLGVSSADEIGDLARTFDGMSMRLEEFRLQLQQQNASLKETNAQLDQFIQFVGHEIADPLTMMVGYCSYLEKHASRLDPRSQEALQGLRKSTTRMHQMVKELLEFNKSKRLLNPGAG